MTATLTKTFEIAEIDGEPRIRDLDLAERLGLARGTNIRTMIAANRDELETHGEVCTRQMQTSIRGGRPGTEYWLTEGQALTICALSRTPAAAKIRQALIRVFLDWRRMTVEKPVKVAAHRRSLPTRAPTPAPTFDRRAHFESFFRAFHDKPEALADWAEAHAQALEDLSPLLSNAWLRSELEDLALLFAGRHNQMRRRRAAGLAGPVPYLAGRRRA